MSDGPATIGVRKIPLTYEIRQRFYCRRCAESCPAGVSIDDWVQMAVGLTAYGLQVWCLTHQCNIIHIDHGEYILPAHLAEVLP